MIPPIRLFGYVLLLWLAMTRNAAAVDYYSAAERITAKDGLPETTIFSMAKDQRGFLWFGTPTSLIRFDGYEYQSYSDRESLDRQLKTSGAGNIFIDSKNRLWVGTWGEGLVVYDEHMQLLNHFVHQKNTPGTLGSNKIQVVFEDSRGDIWVGTNGAGLSLYQPIDNRFINYRHDERKPFSISHDRIWGIAESAPGVLWIATSEGLNRLDTNVNNRAQAQFQRFYPSPQQPNSLNHLMIRAVFVDNKGRLWVGTQIDFGRFKPQSGEFNKIELPNSSGLSAVTRIKQDSKGNLLIGTQQGLYQLDPNSEQLQVWGSSEAFQLFPQNDIRDILVDSSGILWLSTRYAGIIKIDLAPNAFHPQASYKNDGQQAHFNRIFHAFVDNDNTVWLGESSGLLFRPYGQRQFRRYLSPQWQIKDSVTALTQDSQKQLWVGTRSGLYTINTVTAEVLERNDLLAGISTKNVTALWFDTAEGIWIGTAHDGLLHLQSDGQLNVYHGDGGHNTVAGNSIHSLFEDSRQNIWIGTSSSGLSRYNMGSGKFYHYRHHSDDNTSLADDTINHMIEGRDGKMWFATPKTLSSFDREKQTFYHYRQQQGLVNSNIKAVVEDNRGNIWISSIRGVSMLDSETGAFLNYYGDDEAGNTNFLPHVGIKTPSGSLLFGGVGGLTEVNPDHGMKETQAPYTAITKVIVDNQRLPESRFSQGTLSLPHSAKNIQIEFAALDFHKPYENKYQYTLKGVMDNWHGPDSNRVATFNALAPGNYLFKVLGSNSANQWRETPTQLNIEIRSAWYQIWWIRIALVLSILLSLYFLLVYRVKRVERKRALLDAEVTARTKELDEKNEQLAGAIARLNQSQKDLVEKEKMASLGQVVAGIAHEVNTPIGLGITASTLLRQRIEEIRKLFDEKKLNASHFDKFLNESLQNAGIIYRNLERAATLINGFKQVAVDQSSENARYFNVAKVLEQTALTLSPKLQGVPHQLRINCDPDLELYSKPGAISQVVINLVMNSLTHGFNGQSKGEMVIDVSVDGDNCLLIYRDNGSGVAEKIKKAIFDPFVTTNRGKGSTGLGMHLVYNMVTQALQGSIQLQSELGKGVVVSIRFPRDLRVREPAADLEAV